MTPKQAIKHFRTQSALAAALGVSQPAVSNWLSRGAIPAIKQLTLENITGGALQAGRNVRASVSGL